MQIRPAPLTFVNGDSKFVNGHNLKTWEKRKRPNAIIQAFRWGKRNLPV